MKKNEIVLGIDTSNYTTSLCIADTSGNVLKNIKCPLPVKEGEVGLRQSDAVFHHTKNLPCAFRRADGIIAEQGTPEEIFAHPKNQRTQQVLKAVL